VTQEDFAPKRQHISVRLQGIAFLKMAFARDLVQRCNIVQNLNITSCERRCDNQTVNKRRVFKYTSSSSVTTTTTTTAAAAAAAAAGGGGGGGGGGGSSSSWCDYKFC
jgi:uncharacterized membrane protein YgcG